MKGSCLRARLHIDTDVHDKSSATMAVFDRISAFRTNIDIGKSYV